MTRVRIAIVCGDDSLRMIAARAFDAAPPEWDVTLHRQEPSEADVVIAVAADVEGALVLDLSEPCGVVDQVRRHLARRDGRSIAVVGSSGGCGVTTVALHLAAAAARYPCCLLELGDGSSIGHRLALEPGVVGAAPIPVPGGFKVVSAQLEEATHLLDDLSTRFDVVIVDGGRCAVSSILERALAGVLVMAPTVPSARRATAFLSRHPDLSWAVVANRVGPGGETSTADLQRILGRKITLELPCTPGLRDAEDEGRLLAGWSLWRRRVDRLARAVGSR